MTQICALLYHFNNLFIHLSENVISSIFSLNNFNQISINYLQECQRLETILNLCTELGQVAREPAGSAVSDLQKINKELEKLQVSDDDSVFSDSPSSTAQESCFGAKARDFQLSEEQQASQRQQSGYREARSHSPAISLNSSAPSPSMHHRAKVSPKNPFSFISTSLGK